MAISCCGNDLLTRFKVSFEDRCTPINPPENYYAPTQSVFYPEIIKVQGITLGEEGTIDLDDDGFTAKIANGILTMPTITLDFKADVIPMSYTQVATNVVNQCATPTVNPQATSAFAFFHYWALHRSIICRDMFLWITGRDCNTIKFVYRFNGLTMTKLPALGDKEKKNPSAAVFTVSFEQSAPPMLLGGGCDVTGVDGSTTLHRAILFQSNVFC